MKMSDVFTGEVKPRHMDDEAIKELLAGEECGNDWALEDSTYWLATQEEHIKAAAHAINMHDQLVNQLEELLAQAKKLDNIIDMCSGTWAQSEVTNEQDLFSALVSSAETLLTQAKGE